MPLYGRCWLLGAIFLPRPVPQENAPFASLPETLYFHEEMIFAATLMWGPQTLHYPGDKWVSAGVTMPPLNILPLPPTEPTNPPLSDFNFTMLNRFVCLWEYEDSGWGKIPLDHLVNHQKPSQRPQHWVKEVMAKCLLHFSLQAKVWVEDHQCDAEHTPFQEKAGLPYSGVGKTKTQSSFLLSGIFRNSWRLLSFLLKYSFNLSSQLVWNFSENSFVWNPESSLRGPTLQPQLRGTRLLVFFFYKFL